MTAIRPTTMTPAQPGTPANIEAAFGGESMANRKYLFFAEVAKQLGNGDLARLFRDTANQETEHAFAHFRLLHPELVINDPALGDPDSGIASGTPFEAIPADWLCPICGARKASFVPYREPELLAA